MELIPYISWVYSVEEWLHSCLQQQHSWCVIILEYLETIKEKKPTNFSRSWILTTPSWDFSAKVGSCLLPFSARCCLKVSVILPYLAISAYLEAASWCCLFPSRGKLSLFATLWCCRASSCTLSKRMGKGSLASIKKFFYSTVTINVINK